MQSLWAGVSGAWRVGGRRHGASLGDPQGGIAGGARGRWPGAGSRCSCGECQSARRRPLKGRGGEGSILSQMSWTVYRCVSSSLSLGLHLSGGRAGGGSRTTCDPLEQPAL